MHQSDPIQDKGGPAHPMTRRVEFCSFANVREGVLSDVSLEGLYNLAAATFPKYAPENFRLSFFDDENGFEIRNLTRTTFEKFLSFHGRKSKLRIAISIGPASGDPAIMTLADVYKQAMEHEADVYNDELRQQADVYKQALADEQVRNEQLESRLAAAESRLGTTLDLLSDLAPAAKRARR